MHKANAKWLDFSKLFSFVYPTKCPLCGLLADHSPCTTCAAEFIPSALPLELFALGHLDFRASIYAYEGRAAQAVRQLKYHRSTSLGTFMAEQMAEAAKPYEPFVIVPVPIHWQRLYARGFNQAQILASGLNAQEVMKRTRATKPQVGLSREQRLRNLENAFSVVADVSGKSVLLIDDVVTSGQTASECARTLKLNGALEVGILAFCGDRLPNLQHTGPINHNSE